MPRIFKFSKFALKLFVPHASKLTDMKIYIYTDNFDIAYVATSGFKINVNEVGIVIPQNAVSNMSDGVINYRIEGYLNGDFYMEQRQSNYYLKTPSFEMQDTNIIAVSTEFVDGGDYKMIIKASEYNADGLSQVEIDATTFAGEMFEVGRADQKSLLEPITITENGTYENENGYSTIEVNVEGGDCPELEEITINENGTYEGAYDKVIVDVPQEGGGDINPDTLREITITENGIYTSKYSSPIEGEVTGIFDDGTPFYGYGELNGIIYDTQINLNDVGVLESLEFWYKGDNIVVGDAWNIILASNSEDSANEGCVEFRYSYGNENYVRIGGDERSFQLEEGVWHHFKLNKTGDDICTLFVDDVEKESFPLPTATSTNFYINGSVYNLEGNRNANGCFGLININGHIIIPTENGFINYNTQEPLPVVKAGDYTYNTTDVTFEGEPYKTINVDVQPNLVPLEVTLTANGSYTLGVEDGVDGYNRGTIVVDVPQEGGGCNLEPLWVAPNWQDRDESNYVNYNPSEGKDGFDSVHINLFDAYLHGKEETIDSLSEITITENGTYPIKDNILVFDGDDAFNWGRVAENNVIEINFKPIGRGWIFGDENVGLYYDGPYKEIYIYYFQYWDNPESGPWLPVAEGEFSTITIVPERGIIKINDTEFELLLRGDGWTNNQDIIIGGNSEEQRGTFEFRYIKRWNTAEEYEAGVKPIEYINVTQENSLNKNGTPIENIGGGSAEMITLDNGDSVVGYKSVIVNVDTESWYNSGFEDGVENAGSIIAETARVLDITENGIYKSQYSEPTYPDVITGVYPNGENFYSYAQLTNKVFNTGIKLTENTKIEVWYKPKETGLNQYGGIVGTIEANTTDGFSILTDKTLGSISGRIVRTSRHYRVFKPNWVHIELSFADGFVVDGTNIGTYLQNTHNFEKFICINKYINSADGYFGMVKITSDGIENVFIPTANGFLNTNTGRLLEVEAEGDYVFTEELPIYSEGNLIKTINVNVQPNLIPIDKTITKNGTYLFTKQEGMDGYSSGQVVVHVPQNKIDIAEAGIKFGHSTLSSVPEWADFSNVTDMSNMFYECDNITTIPLIDTSNAITMLSMFAYCGNITTIPSINTSNVTDMRNMFYDCRKLTSIPLIDTSKVTDMRNMFYDCHNLTSIPQLDTSKVTDMWWMFHNCFNLTTIPQLDFSNVNDANGMFIYCSNLTNLGGFINLHDDLDISYSDKITRESILNIFNDMAVVTNRSIKLHEVVYSQLTEEDIAIATQKGWSVETEGGGDYEEENGEA